MDVQRHSLKDIIESDKHIEIINGRVVIEDKTTVSHNLAVSEISTALKNYISSNKGACKVFTENIALYVNELTKNDENFFLPDVMVVCDKEGIKEDGVHCAPLFVAEITSESTKGNDYRDKLEVYRKIGVKEYWIVDMQKKVILKCLESEDFIPQFFSRPKSLQVSVYPELVIDLMSVMGD